MSPRGISTIGGICGILGGLLFLAALGIAPPPPSLGALETEVVRYYAQYHHAASIGAFIFACSTPLLLAWAAALAARLRDGEGLGAWLYLLYFGGGAAYATIATTVSFLWMALATRGWNVSAGIAQTLSDFTNYGFAFLGFDALVFVSAAAIVMIRTGVIARALGILGVIVAALQVLYVATALFSNGLMAGGGAISIVGFAALALWLLGVSTTMVVRGSPARGAAPTP